MPNDNTAHAAETSDQSPTETFLRDLYAIAAFYSAHPDLPRPHTISLEHHIHDVASLRVLAGQLAEQPYGAGRSVSHPLPAAPDRVRLHFSVPW